jgi:hypothetical protein
MRGPLGGKAALLAGFAIGSMAAPLSCGAGAAPPTIEAEAAQWRARVRAAGGTVSWATLQATSAFVRQCKAAGIWHKLNRVNLFCGDQLAACLVPLKVGSGVQTESSVNFVAGDYSEATGLTGNGSTKYLNTGVPANSLGAGNRHAATYERVRSAGTYDFAIGYESTTNVNQFGISSDANATDLKYHTGLGTGGPILTPQAAGGLFVGSEMVAITPSLYVNGVSVNSTTLAAATPDDGPIGVFALIRNSPRVITYLSAATLAGYSLGAGLSATEVAAYYVAMQAFQSSLGRQV